MSLTFIGPTCEIMVDMSPSKIFKCTAFEPSEEELADFARAKRRAERKPSRYGSNSFNQSKTRSPSPVVMDDIMELSDSDDELPDVQDMFKTLPKKNVKGKNRVVDSSDVSVDPSSQCAGDLLGEQDVTAANSRKTNWKPLDDDDNDIVFMGMSPAPKSKAGKRKAGADSDVEVVSVSPSRKKLRESPAPPSKKEKEGYDGPSDAVLATWSRGGDDMEPSTKMNALLAYLKEWDASGDKVIVYSQCMWSLFGFKLGSL